jgi:hypothetical protein
MTKKKKTFRPTRCNITECGHLCYPPPPRREYSTTHITVVNSLLNFTEPKDMSRQMRLQKFATGPYIQLHESSSHTIKLLI